jgi:hypothetical protein
LNLTEKGDGTYNGEITLDHSITSLAYTIKVTDISNNTIQSESKATVVLDNDEPEIGDIELDPDWPRSGTIEISVEWTDNIELTDVMLSYKFKENESAGFTNLTTFSKMGNVFTFTVNIPSDAKHFYFNLSANDTSGNFVEIDTKHYWVNVPEMFDLTITPGTLTTGDRINISILVTDEGQVKNVTLHYNDNGSWQEINMTLNNGNKYDIEFNIYSGSTEFKYYIEAKDDNGFTNSTSVSTIVVKDNDDPILIDESPNGTTNDPYIFNVNISDNIGLKSGVTIEWSHGTGSEKGNMIENDGIFIYKIKLNDSVQDLIYTITFEDVNGHLVIYSGIVKVVDNDDPTLSNHDVTPSRPKTGDFAAITVKVSDNIGYNETTVKLFYRDVTDEGFMVTSMDFLIFDIFVIDLKVPEYFSEMYYYFQVEDDFGNIGNSSIYSIDVYDDKSPVFVSNNTKKTATTGDPFIFNLTLNDNVGIDYMYVEYWYGDGDPLEIELDIKGEGLGFDQFCEGEITIPEDSLLSLYYIYHFRDEEGNWWELGPSSISEVEVFDNDAPVVINLIDEMGQTGISPTTGDPFHFSLNITDNIDGREVVQAYVLWTFGDDWSNTRNFTLNHDSDGGNWSSDSFTIQMNSLDILNFSVRAVDSSGNWMIFDYSKIVFDNDAPWMTSDMTGVAGTTGDSMMFSLKADDNIGIGRIELTYRFVDGNRYDGIIMTNSAADTWSISLKLDHILGNCKYHYTIYDSSGNYIETIDSTITMSDNDPPEFFSDMSSKTTTIGHKDYSFRIMIFDNIELSEANVHYFFDFDQTERVLPMIHLSDHIFYQLIDIPNKNGKMTYWFDATDIGPSNNYNDTSGVLKIVDIIDNREPLIGIPDYDMEATTGDTFSISVEVSDDVEVAGARVYYYFGGAMPDPVPFVDGFDSSGTFTFDLDIPDTLDPLNFWIEAFDQGGNSAQTVLFQDEVVDNDAPEFMEFLSDTSAATGEEFLFKVNVTDNIGVDMVEVVYSFTGTDPMIEMLSGDGDSYMLSIMIPNDNGGSLEYHFRAYDGSGNSGSTEPVEIDIIDDEPPVPMIMGPSEAFQHEEVTFSASMSSDNVGIVDYTWTIMEEVMTGMDVSYVFHEVGEYTITLLVTDGVNPAVELSMNITIRDADAPVIVLDMPEVLGNHLPLVGNASASYDNVGITIFAWTIVLPDNSIITANGPVLDIDLEGAIGNITVYLSVSDAEGNDATVTRFVDIKDLLPPVAIGPDNIELLEGDTYTLMDMGSTDNVGVTEWVWMMDGPLGNQTLVGKEITFFFERAGNYSMTLTVYDSAGNHDSHSFYVLVSEKPEDFDADNDGIPDAWEDENGLDKTVNDRNRDYDGGSLSNIRE